MRKTSIFLSLFILTPFLCFAQTEVVFAPFISRLKVSVKEASIVVTWKDSEDIKNGRYLIYRHTEEITEQNFKDALLLGSVAAGVESYTDNPVDRKKYFYLVLAQNEDGKIYELFIPFRNKTTTGVAAVLPPSEEELASAITGIRAENVEDSIVITFSASKKDRDLILYRSTSPIQNSRDLLKSHAIRTFSSSQEKVQDFPIPGIQYYYAIQDAGLVKIGKVSFSSADNTTVNPVQIPLGKYRIGLPQTAQTFRAIPLPYLLITSGIDSGKDLETSLQFRFPKRATVSPAGSKAIARVLAAVSVPNYVDPKPEILELDRAGASAGEEYTLKTILDDAFSKSNWKESTALLENFLSIHRSKEIEARSHFYLGQTYYFQKEYRKAFLEFLLAEEQHYVTVQPWLDAVFRKLEAND